MESPIISTDAEIQAAYERMLEAGESHSIAEMLALQCPPMSDSDREFLEGRGGCYSQFGDSKFGNAVANHYAKVAKQHKVSTTGKVYISGLAEFPGDPRAWISDRGDVKRLCEEKGFGCEGAVKVKSRSREKEPEQVRLAPDIVDHLVTRKVRNNPTLMKKGKQELREMVIDQHGRKAK